MGCLLFYFTSLFFLLCTVLNIQSQKKISILQSHYTLIMGSVGNQDPWAPYDNTKDCSQGICNIYCPQFCYFFFPPPPPSDRFSGAPFSPLIIALIGFLVGVFILVAYYTLISRHFLRGNQLGNAENEENHPHDQSRMASAGLDEAIIAKIAVCKYRKGDGLGLVDSTECAVCLGEFEDNESLRILPKCVHAFHIPCIDTWLKSHSNCPMCREKVAVADEVSHHDEVVLVIDHQETRPHHNSSDNSSSPKSPIPENFENVGRHQVGVSRLRRSVSLGTSSPRRQLLISDIMRGIGSSQSEHCIKRSNSTGFILCGDC